MKPIIETRLKSQTVNKPGAGDGVATKLNSWPGCLKPATSPDTSMLPFILAACNNAALFIVVCLSDSWNGFWVNRVASRLMTRWFIFCRWICSSTVSTASVGSNSTEFLKQNMEMTRSSMHICKCWSDSIWAGKTSNPVLTNLALYVQLSRSHGRGCVDGSANCSSAGRNASDCVTRRRLCSSSALYIHASRMRSRFAFNAVNSSNDALSSLVYLLKNLSIFKFDEPAVSDFDSLKYNANLQHDQDGANSPYHRIIITLLICIRIIMSTRWCLIRIEQFRTTTPHRRRCASIGAFHGAIAQL